MSENTYEGELHVEVNEKNIARFDLVKLTGNTKEELLNHAEEASKSGYILTCRIPMPEDPIEVNVFEAFEAEDVEIKNVSHDLEPNAFGETIHILCQNPQCPKAGHCEGRCAE